MSGNLYQLSYSKHTQIGQSVIIDGPYDYFGRIVKEQRPDPKRAGYTYFLIRGTGNRE